MKWITILALLFSGSLYAETDQTNYQEKKTWFFAADFTYDALPFSSRSELHGHFKFGKKFLPQHTIELGARTPTLAPKFLIKYSYDFIAIDKWTFGASASLLLGLKVFEWCEGNAEACFGVSLNFFVERFVTENASVLLRAGISPAAEGKLTSLSDMNFSNLMGDERFTIGLGGRYYFY